MVSETEGSRVVALGGGHGLSTLLRGLKGETEHLTAIVTVADDGGSSGILRETMGLLPPGDLRDCIAALADAEPLMNLLFQYRFGRGSPLDGHSFGNLLIAAMTGITGDFGSAISEVSRVLAVQGRIVPSSLDSIELCAEVRDSASGDVQLVCGQSRVAHSEGSIERVFLRPEQVKGHPEAVRAILQADLVVIGPGSLYTSVLPNLLIADIREAIRASAAICVYVCNVATQPGETDGYDVGDHTRALMEHAGDDICDLVMANSTTDPDLPAGSGSVMVAPTCGKDLSATVVLGDLVDRDLPWRHDARKLAHAVMRVLEDHDAAGGLHQPAASRNASNISD